MLIGLEKVEWEVSQNGVELGECIVREVRQMDEGFDCLGVVADVVTYFFD
jgi:hypothetical protein